MYIYRCRPILKSDSTWQINLTTLAAFEPSTLHPPGSSISSCTDRWVSWCHEISMNINNQQYFLFRKNQQFLGIFNSKKGIFNSAFFFYINLSDISGLQLLRAVTHFHWWEPQLHAQAETHLRILRRQATSVYKICIKSRWSTWDQHGMLLRGKTCGSTCAKIANLIRASEIMVPWNGTWVPSGNQTYE